MRTFNLAFCLAWLSVFSGCGASTDESEQQRAASIKAVTVQLTTLHPTLDLVGTIVALPERTALLSSQIAGQIGQVCVVEGQSVGKGDPIVVLDARQVQAELAKAAATVEEARANVALLQKGPLPEEIEAARQDARNAAAGAEARRTKLKALEALRSKGEIADVQFDMARSAVTEAEATGQAAKERLKTLQMGTRPEVLAQAKARLRAAESDLALQELNVELSTIRTPIDGVVTQLAARLGASVDKSTPLATVADLTEVFARVRVPGNYMMQVREGANAMIKSDAAGTAEFTGIVARIAQEADSGSGNVSAYVRIQNMERLLRPGLGCRAQLVLPEVPDAIAVPVSAVADRNGVAVVTLIRDGRAYGTEIEIGVRTSDLVQIATGVAPGDVVATDGGYGLPDGCPVAISQEGDLPSK